MVDSLFINEPGTFLGKKSRRVVVKSTAGVQQYSLLLLKEINIIGKGVSLSSDLVLQAAQRGIQINFLDSLQRLQAVLIPPYLSETITAARCQLAAENTAKAFWVAREIISSKMGNQIYIAEYFVNHNSLMLADSEKIKLLLMKMRSKHADLSALKFKPDYQKNIFAIEGRTADYYWNIFSILIDSQVKNFRRLGRGAKDPVNILLNYGYGILYSRILGAVLKSGFLPFAGFIHADRPGKASLVLDVMEIFRQPIVDQTVLRFIEETDMTNDKQLDKVTLRHFSDKILEQFRERAYFKNKRFAFEKIIQIQVENIASFLKEKSVLQIFKCKS